MAKDNDRKNQLLDAAEALLVEGGESALSAKAITERAGLNKALLFYYWGGVDPLVEACLDRFFERHFHALEGEGLDAGQSSRDRVINLVDRYLEFIEQQAGYVRVTQEQIAKRGKHHAMVQKHLNRLLRWTESALEGVVPLTGPLSAKHFQLSLSGIVVNYFTYATTMGEDGWGTDPLSQASLQERREHVKFVVVAWLDALERNS